MKTRTAPKESHLNMNPKHRTNAGLINAFVSQRFSRPLWLCISPIVCKQHSHNVLRYLVKLVRYGGERPNG